MSPETKVIQLAPMSTAQARAHHGQTEINPDLARQFFETLFSAYLKEGGRPAYIEVRGKREADERKTDISRFGEIFSDRVWL